VLVSPVRLIEKKVAGNPVASQRGCYATARGCIFLSPLRRKIAIHSTFFPLTSGIQTIDFMEYNRLEFSVLAMGAWFEPSAGVERGVKIE
jgi:hypothetical protein